MKPFRTPLQYEFIALLSVYSLMAGVQVANFSYTGTIQTFTVPVGVISIAIGVEGASGGSIQAAAAIHLQRTDLAPL